MGKSYTNDLTKSLVYNVEAKAPFDIRLVVDTVDDLIISDTWSTSSGDVNWAYNGMLTVTKDTGDVYVLIDNTNPNNPDVTDINNWKKVGSNEFTEEDYLDIYWTDILGGTIVNPGETITTYKTVATVAEAALLSGTDPVPLSFTYTGNTFEVNDTGYISEAYDVNNSKNTNLYFKVIGTTNNLTQIQPTSTDSNSLISIDLGSNVFKSVSGLASTKYYVLTSENLLLTEDEVKEYVKSVIDNIKNSITTIDGNITTINGNISNINNRIDTANNNITTINTDIKDINNNITTINTNLDTKVDKVAGKGLSTNDFTTDYKTKLDNLTVGSNVTLGGTVSIGDSATIGTAASIGSEVVLPNDLEISYDGTYNYLTLNSDKEYFPSLPIRYEDSCINFYDTDYTNTVPIVKLANNVNIANNVTIGIFDADGSNPDGNVKIGNNVIIGNNTGLSWSSDGVYSAATIANSSSNKSIKIGEGTVLEKGVVIHDNITLRNTSNGLEIANGSKKVIIDSATKVLSTNDYTDEDKQKLSEVSQKVTELSVIESAKELLFQDMWKAWGGEITDYSITQNIGTVTSVGTDDTGLKVSLTVNITGFEEYYSTPEAALKHMIVEDATTEETYDIPSDATITSVSGNVYTILFNNIITTVNSTNALINIEILQPYKKGGVNMTYDKAVRIYSKHEFIDKVINCGLIFTYNYNTEYFELFDAIKDLTYEDMQTVVAQSNQSCFLNSNPSIIRFNGLTARTLLPIYAGFAYDESGGDDNDINLAGLFQESSKLETIPILDRYKDSVPALSSIVNMDATFKNCSNLKILYTTFLVKDTCTFIGTFTGCSALEYIGIGGVANNISFVDSPNLSYDTLDALITAAANTKDGVTKNITVTVHPDVYSKINDTSSDWHTLYTDASAKSITIVSTTASGW